MPGAESRDLVIHPLLARARVSGTPIIDNEQASLLWEGADPPLLVGDFNSWDTARSAPWTQIAPDLWSHTLTLPLDAYIEYRFQSGTKGDERVPDPFNERVTPDGIGQINHFFYMPNAAPTSLTQRVRGVPQGVVTRHRIENQRLIAGGRRIVYLYRPPTDDPCPLIVVYDGQDYLRRARLPTIVDNLIAQGRIRPVALALVENGGPARILEYACNEATIGFLCECVLPLAHERLNLVHPKDEPGVHGVMGASMGGLMALFTGLRVPSIFGRVLSQSGAFRFGQALSLASWLVKHAPVEPIKIWLDVGRYESGLLPTNREMRSLLQERDYDCIYREYNAGHNYPAWRDDLWRGLEALFPPVTR